MIPANFSISRQAIEFIYEQQASDSSHALINFARQELLTRIIGVSLSIFVLVDFGIHSAAIVEATFYAIYKGIIEEKPIDFSQPEKHFKCLKLFLCNFPTASIIGLIDPDIKMFATIENTFISSIRSLLLSRNEKFYTENHHTIELPLIKYIQALAKNMDGDKKAGMDETLQLLEKTNEIEVQFERQTRAKIYVLG